MKDTVKRSFQVDIDVIRQHTYIIDSVNSPEEAEDVARQWLAEGEEGTVSNVEEFDIDSFPVEEGEVN
jgi:hypothetical protein